MVAPATRCAARIGAVRSSTTSSRAEAAALRHERLTERSVTGDQPARLRVLLSKQRRRVEEDIDPLLARERRDADDQRRVSRREAHRVGTWSDGIGDDVQLLGRHARTLEFAAHCLRDGDHRARPSVTRRRCVTGNITRRVTTTGATRTRTTASAMACA